jgi:hypothetical protein
VLVSAKTKLGSLRGFFDGFLFGFRDCLMLDFLLDNDFLFGIREEDNFIILVLSCAVGKCAASLTVSCLAFVIAYYSASCLATITCSDFSKRKILT